MGSFDVEFFLKKSRLVKLRFFKILSFILQAEFVYGFKTFVVFGSQKCLQTFLLLKSNSL